MIYLHKIIFIFCGLLFLISTESFAEDAPSERSIAKQQAPFPGYLYSPTEGEIKGVIILLHGSDGGNGDFWYYPGKKPTKTGEDTVVAQFARVYAKKGYITYALCYFDCAHHKGFTKYPPNELKNVSLKIISDAIKWSKDNESTRGLKVALWGASRGAELSILYASIAADKSEYEEPDAVVSLSPIEYAAPAFPLSTANAIKNGELPSFELASSWLNGDIEIAPLAPIRIGKYKKPVYISYFEKDPIWQAGAPGSLITSFLKEGTKITDINYSFFKKGASPDDLLKGLDSDALSQRVFLEFEGTGHVFPPFESEEKSFLKSSILMFLEQNL